MCKACKEKEETKERNEQFFCSLWKPGCRLNEQVLIQNPSVEDFVCMLERCKQVKDRLNTLHLHACISKRGLESHGLLGNYLVSVFVDLGSMAEAQRAFEKLANQNEHSSNALIMGYVRCGMPYDAINLHQKLKECRVIHGTAHTFVALLKACSQVKDLERGSEIHAMIEKDGSLVGNLFVGNTLINMYIKCGSADKAQDVFDKLPFRNVVSWTTVIAGYVTCGHAEKALYCYENMQLEGVSPDAITFIFGFQACNGIESIDKGQEIRNQLVKKGGWSLKLKLLMAIPMDAKCGWVVEATRVFKSFPINDVVSWTLLITEYAIFIVIVDYFVYCLWPL